MRSVLWTSIALMLLGSFNAWSAVQPLELKVKDEVLRAKAIGDGMTLVLPEFLVFTQTGTAVFHDNGFNELFVSSVERAMKSAAPIENALGLREVLAEVVAMDGSPLSLDIDEKYEFVFVEYWADWCAPCHKQKEAIAQFLADRKDAKILWLYIRRDPALLPEVTVRN